MVTYRRAPDRGPRCLYEEGDEMKKVYSNNIAMDPSGFVLLTDYVPHVIQEIRYFSTYNFMGERIDGYEEPCALITK